MKFKRLMSILLSMIMAVGILAGCGGNTVSVTEPASQESVKVQGPAMWLDRDNVFEIYERTTESGVSQQNYWTNLPYESHSKSMLSYYIETHLLEEAGLTLLQQDEIELEDQMFSMLFFTHPEAEVIPETNYCLMLLFWEADGGGTEVQIDYSDSLTLEEWDATVQAAPEPEHEPEPQSSDPAVLPDFLKMGTDYEVSSSTTSHMKVYTEDNMDISAVETYLQQPQDMGYAIVYTETDDFEGINRRWELAHRGLDAETISENGAHVIVQSNTYTSWNDQTLSIEFSDGITMDSDNVPQSSSSSGGGYVDCPSCYGGNCTACNGSKGEYSYSPGLEREWEECWKCRGTGKCSKCGGSGQIFG